ncbi:uncharacterized protein TNCV_2274771 [Trichonephila clavipes]|nr:uncharacterized protein TNCV_2274771 [Trichonephila clavipes]
MACDAEDCRFQMLNDGEIVTSVQEESSPVDADTDEDDDNGSSKGHQMQTRFLRWRQLWTNSYQNAGLLSTTAAQENQRSCSEGVQWYSEK